MKTNQLNKGPEKKKLHPWMQDVRQLEKDDKEKAIVEYKKILSTYPLTEEAYDRIMILFRQLKQSKEELYWIDRAIRTFEKSFKQPGEHLKGKVATLSRSLLRTTGLVDKKGKSLYLPAPISRWQKRKELLVKRQG
jgi:hypothetical protein